MTQTNGNDGELDNILVPFFRKHLPWQEELYDELKAAIESLLERRGLEARKDEIQKFLAVNVSHPEAYATAIAIHADNRLAELSQRGEIRAKHG